MRLEPFILALALAALPGGALARGGGHGAGRGSGTRSSSGGHASAPRPSHATGGSKKTSQHAATSRPGHASTRSHAWRRFADQDSKRDREQRRRFMRTHPCPSTGKTHGGCPGYVVDHVRALKHGGTDSPSHMQWQTVVAAKSKDKVE